MGGFSILGEVAKGFTQAAQTDQTRAFQQDMVAREGASKAIDSLIASGAVDQSQIPELLQRRMAIMTEPYKPYRPGKTPSWGKHADLSTLKYQAPTPPPQGMQPSQPQVGPGAGGAASPPPGTSGPPTPQASVGALPLNPSPLNAISQPEVSFQPPTPPPTQGLRVLSPEERGAMAGRAGAAQEKAIYEARLEQAHQLGLSGTEAAQYASGKQIIPAGRYNTLQTWEDAQGNPIPVLVNRSGGGATGINGEPLPEGAHPAATMRNVIAQLPDGSRQPAFENKFGQLTDGQGNVLQGATVVPTAAIPTTRNSTQTYNPETGTTATSSTSQKNIAGGPTPPPSQGGGGVTRPSAATGSGVASSAGKSYGTWAVPRLDARGYSVSGKLPDVVDDIRKGSAVAGEAWDWANLGIKPAGGGKQAAAVRAYMGRHGLEPTLGPSTQARSRAAAADSMRPIISRAIELINQNRDKLGVLPGRMEEFEKRIGNIDPQVAALYGDLKSIYSFAGTMHGWRALQVADEFEGAYGGLHTNPDSIVAALKELDRTADETIRTASGKLSSPSAPPTASVKVMSQAAIAQAARDHNVSVEEATRQAKQAGYEVK